MKTKYIIAAYRNAQSPAAQLSARLNRPLALRRAKQYSEPLDLSSADCENQWLWLDEKSTEILETFAGRIALDHRGWYEDNFDGTLETYAVRLARFPKLLFYAVRASYGEDLRVDLAEWEEIDFDGCENERHAADAIEDASRSLIRSNDRKTEREAEDNREFDRVENVRNQIGENAEELKNLRHEIRGLCGELKNLCPSGLAALYPSAAKAVRQSLETLLQSRRDLMAANTELSASI